MESLKQKLKEILGEKIKFNKDFDKYVKNLKEGMKKDFLEWANRCKEGIELGSVPPKRKYKNFYVFFRKIGENTRVVLIKEQNREFIELILENHYGYDKKRQELGYKKSSYYKS